MEIPKRHIYSTLLLLGSCAVSLLIAEGIVRIFYPESRDHVTPHGLVVLDKYLGWKLNPNIIVSHHSSYFDVIYATNSLGFRDKMRQVVKPNQIRRVLLFGDSQVFGWGIAEKDRFSNLVESSKQDTEIWNLGVPGYGLDQEILAYEREGLSMNADEVIFLITESTLARIHTDFMYMKYKPAFELDRSGRLRLRFVPQGRTSIIGAVYSVLNFLYLPYFLELQLQTLQNLHNRSDSDKLPADDSLPEQMGDLEKKLLVWAKDMAADRKQRLMVLAALPERMSSGLKYFCRQIEIEYVGISVDDRNPDTWVGPKDRHWNRRTHKEIAAQFLSQSHHLFEKGYLNQPVSSRK